MRGHGLPSPKGKSMFIGHFAVGLIAKRAAPRASLGTLFFAAQFMDLLWPVLLLTGVEAVRIDPGNTIVTPLDLYNYPWSHGLYPVLIWAAVLALLYWLLRRSLSTGLVLGLVLASHWLLDYVTHRPDLPLAPGDPRRFGLGLWNSLPGSIAVEAGLFVLGIWIYTGATRPENRRGVWALWSLALVLLAIQAANYFGPPPPDEQTLAYSALGIWLFVFWGAWADRNRRVVKGGR